MISFKGAHFPREIIMFSLFFYVRYGVSYRDLEEIMEERGVKIDHSTLFQVLGRWVKNALDYPLKQITRECDQGDPLQFLLPK